MLIYTLKRLGLAVLVLFTASLISFMLTRFLTPTRHPAKE